MRRAMIAAAVIGLVGWDLVKLQLILCHRLMQPSQVTTDGQTPAESYPPERFEASVLDPLRTPGQPPGSTGSISRGRGADVSQEERDFQNWLKSIKARRPQAGL